LNKVTQALKGLNESQRVSATHIDGSLLILAGAGSGKTKTITTRVAYLIDEVGIDANSILVLTFTNKAASEMRQRALSMIQSSSHGMPLLCTFHKFGLLFLRFHIEKLNRSNSFSIIDSDDRKKILKGIIKEHETTLSNAQLYEIISKLKNDMLFASDLKDTKRYSDYPEISEIYTTYEAFLIENNLVDFDDLLLLSYKLLRDDEALRQMSSKKYQYIMVDEYQDTNALQFNVLKLLCQTHQNICVVGDDDQSIYSWRGADISNILDFSLKFPNTKVVKLETNYRSTKAILEVASEVISNNEKRIGKNLISNRGEGESVNVFVSYNEIEESQKIAKAIKKLLISGVNAKDIAILYRLNALSRGLEEGLMKEKIAFKILGGVRFYDRMEIKDIIAYFRIFINPHDNFWLLRVINRPKRGVGEKSLQKLQSQASQLNLSLYGFISSCSLEDLAKLTTSKSAIALKKLAQDIEQLKISILGNDKDFLDLFDKLIDLKAFYQGGVDGEDRVFNIDEFYGYFRDNIRAYANLEEFLNEISLLSDADEVQGDKLCMMSIHSSKGLEFEHLFVVGWEEGIFPVLGDNIEEERRLAYVAITRAKSHLTLSSVHSRFYKGKRESLSSSRFLKETNLFKIAPKPTMSSNEPYKIGEVVKHKIFGIGKIEALSKSGVAYKLSINFGGNKKDILSSFVEKI